MRNIFAVNSTARCPPDLDIEWKSSSSNMIVGAHLKFKSEIKHLTLVVFALANDRGFLTQPHPTITNIAIDIPIALSKRL